MKIQRFLDGQNLIVVGAGLVGTLTAIQLQRRGAQVLLLEKRSDMRQTNIPGGRSIAMSLSERGWHALNTVGLADTIRAGAMAKHRRCVHLPDGSIQEQVYGNPDDALWTVNRKTLNSTLLDGAEAAGVELRFNCLCEQVDLDVGKLLVRDITTDSTEVLDCDHLFGADGINSIIRQELCRVGCISDELLTLDYRYFELVIPPAADGGFLLDRDGVHIWPRPEGLLVALPNIDGSFSGTLFFAKKGDNSFSDSCSAAERAASFAAAFSELANLVPDYAEQLAVNPPCDIKAVRCSPWQIDGRVGLIGDACHAIVPFYAMGMNAGFEDVTIFDELLEEFQGDLKKAIPAFCHKRKPCTDAIGDLSLHNFQSIGQSADPDYDRRWRLERRIWDLMPTLWTPLYPMIHFGRTPLKEVILTNRKQSHILDILMQDSATEQADEELISKVKHLLGNVTL